jgi:YidC/Oxa1 family membrane protein insertase
MPEYKSPQSEPGMDKNILLIFLLLAIAIFGAQLYMRKYAPQAPQQQKSSAQPVQQPIQPGAPSAQPAAAAIAQPANKRAPAKSAAPQAAANVQATSESETVIENDLYRITFTNRGAQVKSWILKKFNDDNGKPLDLVNATAAAKYGYPLSLWTYDENVRNTLNSALYVPSTTESTLQAPAQIQFDFSNGWLTVRKTFHFDHSYVVGVETSVFSNGSPVHAFPAWPSGFGDETTLSGYASGELEYQVNDNTERISVKKVSGGNTLQGRYNWIGVSSQYFGAVFIPDSADNVVAVTLNSSVDIVTDSSKPNETKPVDVPGVAVGRPGNSTGRLFAGPKALAVLESVSVPTISGAAKDLRSMINFGWFGPIARPLFLWLRWTNQYIHNWGWSIVLQTIIITLALVPLRFYQLKSALKMQRVQPQMKAIQEKYKKYSMRDPRKQEMNKEIADLYKREGVNPVGGCLPLLMQLPFLYAYYRMLSTAIDLRQAHWLWIHDLSAADPWYLLPIVMAVSMFVLQKMTPQGGIDPAQQRMMNIMMPVMMGFFFFKLPAGLNLYYALSNVIMIAQTWVMNRTELGREMREMAAKRARKKDK